MTNQREVVAGALLPCPFCGSPASLYRATRAIHAHVTCSSEACEACGPALYSPEAAIEMWNKRAALRTPASEADMARAEQYVRSIATMPNEIRSAILEALAAYDPERMARCGNTVSDGDGGRVANVLCIWCGTPTMHNGNVCFFCSKAAKTTQQEAGEAVAWAIRDHLGGLVELTASQQRCEQMMATNGGGRPTWTAEPLYTTPPTQQEARAVGDDTARLDYIERTFSGMTNRERYLPVQMIWGKGCNGRSLREACDKYMSRDAATEPTP